MPSFSDSIFLFVLALLLFGPKRLPVLARELGKWVGEFRRASNEFKMQMDEELRLAEQAERNKKLAAIEAAAPTAPALEAAASSDSTEDRHPERSLAASGEAESKDPEAAYPTHPVETLSAPEPPAYEMVDGVRRPVPIATSGELSIMPPATGLPIPQARSSALDGLLHSIPEAEPETTHHGD